MARTYISGLDLANHFLKHSFRDKIPVNLMKLQRLAYYACVMYLQETETPMIDEHFYVWKYGAVLHSLYYKFSVYKDEPIGKYARDAKGKIWVVNSPEADACCAYVWSKFRNMPTIELAERAHGDGSGWYAAFQREDQIITLEDMRNDTTL